MKRKRFPTNANEQVPVKKPKYLSGNKKGSFEHRLERRRYLSQLLQEFQTTLSMECKQQVLANFANFAYDPYNYNFFQELGILPVFLAELSVNRNLALTEFAMAGICNCGGDKRLQKEILKNDTNLRILKGHINSSSKDVVLSLVTTLITFAHGSLEMKEIILADDFLGQLKSLLTHEDKRVRNVVQVLHDELTMS